MRPMLAGTWRGEDPTGWIMSEKLDGFRAMWDGKQLTSREGNIFPAPAWFTDRIPETPLDGELWAGRGPLTLNITKSVVQGKNPARWMKLRFMVFDIPIPEHPIDRSARLQDLKDSISEGGPVGFVPQRFCIGMNDLLDKFAYIKAIAGEGIVLRHPHAIYEPSRHNADYSKNMLKLRCADRPDLLPIPQKTIDELLK